MSSSSAARTSIVIGALAVAAIPAAFVVSQLRDEVDLLRAIEVAVPLAIVLGLIAVSLARRARYKVDRSVNRNGARLVRLARMLAWAALYLGASGAIALGFYGVLVLGG